MTCNTRRRTVTKGTHLLRSALLALLALAVISGGSLAAGDLFDDDYSDCPHRTRLRDGQISDLSVNRDADDEDHVNVAWSATDPATWGLGPNAYSTSLVVILDDGSDTQTETLSLGSRKTTFEGVDTGTEVTVQMAIVVDTADGDYLISDILEDSINQSLTAPGFSADVWRVTTAAVTANPEADPVVAAADEVREETDGILYYVGYNQNFGNYKAATGLTTSPSTPRLRIGLAHSTNETSGDRDDVDFDAYIVRITDEDGDVVSEGDDVATVASNYGTNRLAFGIIVVDTDLTAGEFSNVRISEDDEFQAAIQDGGTSPGTLDRTGLATMAPATLSGVQPFAFVAGAAGAGATGSGAPGVIYAMPPDEHRDFPLDVVSSDETYKFTAWAINEDNEVISPVASLTVRPLDESSTATEVTDYLNTTSTVSGLILTEFTVLR